MTDYCRLPSRAYLSRFLSRGPKAEHLKSATLRADALSTL